MISNASNEVFWPAPDWGLGIVSSVCTPPFQ
jgi:hypothetical protein